MQENETRKYTKKNNKHLKEKTKKKWKTNTQLNIHWKQNRNMHFWFLLLHFKTFQNIQYIFYFISTIITTQTTIKRLLPHRSSKSIEYNICMRLSFNNSYDFATLCTFVSFWVMSCGKLRARALPQVLDIRRRAPEAVKLEIIQESSWRICLW